MTTGAPQPAPTEVTLRPRMSLAQVAEAAGNAAIFVVAGASFYSEGLHGDGTWRENGEGTLRGTTATTPPLRWSIQAKYGLSTDGAYRTGATMNAAQLQTPRFYGFSLTDGA